LLPGYRQRCRLHVKTIHGREVSPTKRPLQPDIRSDILLLLFRKKFKWVWALAKEKLRPKRKRNA
jgi:hypothetical protein